MEVLDFDFRHACVPFLDLFVARRQFVTARIQEILQHPEQVGIAERQELTNWKQRKDPWARRIAFYVAMFLIPVVVLGLLFLVAKHTGK